MQIFNIVEELEKERKKNKELEELCNKYEEEHKTTFEIWQKDIKSNKKALEYIEEMQKSDLIFTSICEKELINILKGE